MDENLRQEAPPLPTDLAAVCRRSLSHTATEPEMSDLTMEGSKHAVNRNGNQNVFHQASSDRQDPRRFLLTDIQDGATKWTDEKHHSYLNFLEASFVNQLSHSKGLVGWYPKGKNWKPIPSHQLSGNTPVNCHQFVVLRDGCWWNINFEQNKPPTRVAVYSNVMRQSSSHCSSVGKQQITSSSDSQQCSAFKSKKAHLQGSTSFSCGLASSSKQLQMRYLCHENPVGSTQEGSDQNFVDEDPAETSTNLPREKRLKMVSTDPSSKDQVVPSEAFFRAEGLTTSKASSERESQTSHDLKPENPENLDSWKSAVEPFLRGS